MLYREILLVILCMIFYGHALTCHSCWYDSPEIAKKALYDKLQASPRYCSNHNYCEGLGLRLFFNDSIEKIV